MRSKRWLIVLASFVVVFTLVGAGTALAAGSHVAPARVAPPGLAAMPPGALLVEDITYTSLNEQDPGNLGYWALDDGFVHFQVWQVSPHHFYTAFSAAGVWTTFAGALSPNSQPPDVVVEQAGGSGPFYLRVAATFSGSIKRGLQRFGYLGTIDRGETEADILKGYYADQTGDTNPWDPIASYYTSKDGFSDWTNLTWYQWWGYKCQTASVALTDNNWVLTGDIVITK